MGNWSKYIAIYMGFTIIFSMYFLSVIGFFDLPNGVLYDTCCELTPKNTNGCEKVMVVQINHEQLYSDDDTWILLLNQLNNFGASQVIFSFFPPNTSKQFYNQAAMMGNVIFGRQKLDNKEKPNEYLFESIPVQAQNEKIITAPYDLPVNQYGIHRFEHGLFEINGKRVLNFIMTAAEMRGEIPHDIDQQFAVNFIASSIDIPTVEFERIISGNIVTELLRDRTVLIGLKKAPDSPGFQTPVHSGSRGLSLVEYNGYALDTLLEGKVIKRPDLVAILSFISFIVVFSLLVYPLLSDAVVFVCAALFYVFSFVIFWALLRYAFFWSPIVEVIVAKGVVLVFIFAKKYSLKNRIAKEMVLSKSVQIKERFFPTGFYASQEYWSRVINMVNQTLNLERAIFLEKVINDHRVKEIIALNTSINEIQERRRDYERTPYSTAIKENRPIQVELFFKNIKDEAQYLVPLNYGGEIQGFWAFVISPDHASEIKSLLPTIRSFAVEIGELLYKRDKWIVEEKSKKNLVRKLLTGETREEVYHEVNNIISMLARRVSTLDHVLNSLESAIILYNIFGQVTHVNMAMSNILKDMDIAPFKMSALDLAIKLTGHSAEEMRNMFSQTIINHEMLSLPVTLPHKTDAFLLSIRPLVGDDNSFQQEDEAYPFNLHGMLFEMMDMTEVKDFSVLKAELFERSNAHLKDGVESITNACMLLEDNDMIADDKDRILQDLSSKKENIVGFMDELNDYMGREVFSDTYQIFPVSTLKLIKDSLSNLKDEVEKRKILFEIVPDVYSDLILAVPGDLKKLCEALLSILLQDAYDETTIHIQAQFNSNNIVYSMHNSGYGMPDEDFQRYLTFKHLADSKPYKMIHSLSPKLKMWKGGLAGISGVGKGIKFHLQLRKFQ